MRSRPRRSTLCVAARHRLSLNTFEILFRRLREFRFAAGQKIRSLSGDISSDYTLVNGSGNPTLAICVRQVPGGRFTPVLAAARPNETFASMAGTPK